jgi:DNA-binding transcriptional ArsR family regulator
MAWLDGLVGETRAQLLRLVRRASLSIGDLAAALGISENAVRNHVAAAERDGLVRSAGVQRSTGGKPARLYELTAGAEELFPKAYALVFAELVRTLREEDGDRPRSSGSAASDGAWRRGCRARRTGKPPWLPQPLSWSPSADPWRWWRKMAAGGSDRTVVRCPVW